MMGQSHPLESDLRRLADEAYLKMSAEERQQFRQRHKKAFNDALKSAVRDLRDELNLQRKGSSKP